MIARNWRDLPGRRLVTRLRRFFELGAAGMWQSPGGVHVWIEPDNMVVDSCIGRAEQSVTALSLKKYVQVTRRKKEKGGRHHHKLAVKR